MPEDNKELKKEAVESIEELEKKVLGDAKEYIFNVMEFGSEYSEEIYQDKLEESHKEITKEGSQVFSVYDPSMMQLNLTILMQGYANFGADFINNVIYKDPESAKVILESVTQDWLDLQNFVRDMSNKMENAIKQSQENLNDKVENKEGN